MIKVLVDENLSEYFAEGLNYLQKPLDKGIIVTSINKEFFKGIKDEDWIPLWGKERGIFITQDRRISISRQQAALLKKFGLGAFFLDTPKNYRYWDRVKLVVNKWPEITDIILRGSLPYAYQITPRSIHIMKIR